MGIRDCLFVGDKLAASRCCCRCRLGVGSARWRWRYWPDRSGRWHWCDWSNELEDDARIDLCLRISVLAH